MNIPLSWLKDFVDMSLPLEELARVMTMSGLEVDEVRLVGLPAPENELHGFKFTGLSWPADKFVVAEVREVKRHPEADRLTLCKLEDGTGEHTILTGAPNLFPYIGLGRLEKPLKVAYAREGAILYDGHKSGFELTKLKRTKIRGFETKSMVCSAKELGISEEHEGILILDSDAPTGMALADYIGDAVYVIDILPNMARNASVKGVAREVAAQLNLRLKQPRILVKPEGKPIDGMVKIEINDPELNPRFMVGYAEGVKAQPSPFWVQRRLYLAGMRPINSIVDATNYVMLETGQPLHSFDFDTLKKRAGEKTPTIITRRAYAGEKLTTLDNVQRDLDESMMLVTDQSGSLSIAGIMGGRESEIEETSSNILLESATWNFINVRKTAAKLRLNSEAGYRNSRGIHPAIAEEACALCLARIVEWSGGRIAPGFVDNYPLPAIDPEVSLTESEIFRLLGVNLSLDETAELLARLDFVCAKTPDGKTLMVKTPPYRLDIGEGVIGRADVLEEVARIYGYDNIPQTRMADELPPAYVNLAIKREDMLRDALVSLGMQEIVTYRMTSPEREAKLTGCAESAYTTLINPISPDRSVMRRNLLVNMMETIEKNIRLSDHLAFFEIGPAFIPETGRQLPHEEVHLAMSVTGKRFIESWDTHSKQLMDFFDLKGIIEATIDSMHISGISFRPDEIAYLHPGKTAAIYLGEEKVGVLGELHPAVREHYDLTSAPILLADINLEKLLPAADIIYKTRPISPFPPIYEDIAVIVDEGVSAAEVMDLIKRAGGKMLADVELFDIFRGDQLGADKKSLAFNLMYQSEEKTLTDKDATAIRAKIVKRLEQTLGAKLRSA